jgi:hypothetical protein
MLHFAAVIVINKFVFELAPALSKIVRDCPAPLIVKEDVLITKFISV